ncbi:MAG: tetratricopeptide repeat protein [bacterium]
MKHLNKILLFLICSAFAVNGHSQKMPPANSSGQQKVVRLNPVKVDTTDPNKKALNKFSKETMFNVASPAKAMKPEEVRAMSFFTDGSKKGKTGDYQGAVADFTRSLDLVKNVNTYAKRGYAYLMIGNYGAAISDETEALRLQESYMRAYFVRGLARFETGDYKASKADLDIFLDRDRTNAIAFNYMAAIMFMNQDFKSALENYNEVLRLDPKYPDIYTNRGMMRHYNQDFKGAIQDYNEALKTDPNNATAYNNRGAAKMMLKELEAAMVDFTKAISINTKYADAYDNRGRVKHALGDTQGACEDWQVAYANGLAASKDLILKFCK